MVCILHDQNKLLAMDFNRNGKIALVGGSSKGLGKACALSLATEGANIVLCARNEEALQNTRMEIESIGVEVLALVADMSNEDDNKRVVQAAVERFDGIDSLINNSGGPKPGTFRDISEADLDQAYHSVLK